MEIAPMLEAPKGRRLRRCDALAVPVHQVDDALLASVLTPYRGVATLPTSVHTLSSVRLQDLCLQSSEQPQVQTSCPSEGTGLTPEELDLIRSVAKDDESESGSGTEEGDWVADSDPANLHDAVIQANGSAYHAMALGNMKGVVGVGISRAFGSSRECKGRHATFLLSAGRFAACIFGHDGRVEEHKTFKRYVVRGKQGGAQSSHDKVHGKARSIGAQMRRDGERKLAEDVRALMSTWADRLQSCGVVFVSCPPPKRSTLFGEWLQSTDPRVRRIPFAGIGKPSLEACIKAHSLVCSVLFFHSWPPGVTAERLPRFPPVDLPQEPTPQMEERDLAVVPQEDMKDPVFALGAATAPDGGKEGVLIAGVSVDITDVATQLRRRHPRRSRSKFS